MTRLGKKLEWIYKLRGEDVQAAIGELQRVEQSDTQAVADYKERKLRELLEFVSRECAFYRDIARQALTASKNGSALEALRDLPTVDKGTIKNNQSAFVCPRMRTSLRSTSGTTGSPFVFPKDRHASAYMDAMMYNAYEWHGIGPMTRQARIWGSAVSVKGKAAQKSKDLLLGRKRLSAFEISDANCRQYFYQLLRHKPRYFYCYPNAMYQFVLSLERLGLDGRQISASVVICTGEVLLPHQKEKIKQVTECQVVNEYGSTENGIIAFECEYGTMHLLPTVHVNVVDPDKDGFGEIVVTELNSRSVPFINYKIGDIGRVLDYGCKCGRPFEALEIQEGRVGDFILCSDGSAVYSAILAYVLKDYVVQFRAYQDETDLINIYIIPNNSHDVVSEEKIRSRLRKYLGKEMRINFTVANNIPPEKSGKLRYFVSRIR